MRGLDAKYPDGLVAQQSGCPLAYQPMSDLEQLQKAITALEAQRATLGNEVVDAALASMREKLARLHEQQPPSGRSLNT